MFKKKKLQNRYFLVFYTGISKTRGRFYGQCAIMTDYGFLNQKKTEYDIKEAIVFECEIVLTNIVEISKEENAIWHK